MTTLSGAKGLPPQRGSCEADGKSSRYEARLLCSYPKGLRFNLGYVLRSGTWNSADDGRSRNQFLRLGALPAPTSRSDGCGGANREVIAIGAPHANLVLRCNRWSYSGQLLALSVVEGDRQQAKRSYRRLCTHQARASAGVCHPGGAPDAPLEAQE